MEKKLWYILTVTVIVSTIFIFIAYTDTDNENIHTVTNINTFDRVIKAEFLQENGDPYNGYEFYTYFYFKDNTLIYVDNVYVFSNSINAQNWYKQNIEGRAEISKWILDENTVYEKNVGSEYIGLEYDVVLNSIKDKLNTVSYTQQ